MRRLPQVFCLSVFLFFFLSAANAEDGLSFIPAQISSELQDSLKNSPKDEPTLQQVLDDLGYNIDVEDDRLPTEIWVAIAGQYSQVMMAELAGCGPLTSSGWYVAGSPDDSTVIFRGANIPGDTAFFTITGCDSNGLFIAPFAGKYDYYVYYTEPDLNPDLMDHAWVYWTKVRPNEFIVAWEDCYELGDADYQDMVLLYQLPNRPPILSVPDDTTYGLCLPQTICFGPVTAYDEDYYDTLYISMISGPGTFEGDSCYFMPAGVDSTYEFIFVATDWLGAADTQSVTIVVDVNEPLQLTCPDDGNVHAGDTFVSTNFSVTDPDGDLAPVTFLDITPSAINSPTIVSNHVEWVTTCAEDGDYVIRLVATDNCGTKDTCEFTVNVSKDFTISAAPDTQYVTQGEAVGYEVKLNSLFGFDEPCTLFVSDLPAPPDSGVFDEAVLTPTDSTTLNVYTTAETDTGWYTLTITAQRMPGAKPNGLEHSIQVVLKVEEPGDAGDWTDNPNAPKSFALFQNQPNPFNPETKISYYLPRACQVKLTIYNVLGQRVKTLFDGHQDAGTQTLLWDGRSDDGVQLSSGIYFYRLQADNFHQTKKMTLVK